MWKKIQRGYRPFVQVLILHFRKLWLCIVIMHEGCQGEHTDNTANAARVTVISSQRTPECASGGRNRDN